MMNLTLAITWPQETTAGNGNHLAAAQVHGIVSLR